MTRCTYPALVSILLFAACGPQSTDVAIGTAEPTNGGAVRFNATAVSAESGDCTESPVRCARVEVRSLETAGGGTEIVRDNIDLYLSHDIVARMRGFVPEEIGNRLADVERLAAAFLAEHRAFVEDFPDATAAWSIEITARSIYNTPVVTTIGIDETSYTGGAHPNSRLRLASFDVTTGQLLGIDDLAVDIAALTALVEQRLRFDRGLADGDDLASAGFWIPEDGLTLPDNLGVVADGLLVHWDAYEIAPYSMGAIDVRVPSGELEGIVDRDYW